MTRQRRSTAPMMLERSPRAAALIQFLRANCRRRNTISSPSYTLTTKCDDLGRGFALSPAQRWIPTGGDNTAYLVCIIWPDHVLICLPCGGRPTRAGCVPRHPHRCMRGQKLGCFGSETSVQHHPCRDFLCQSYSSRGPLSQLEITRLRP
jgi:hypothetical protein